MHIAEEKKFVIPYCGAKIALRAKYLRSSDLVQLESRFVTLKNGKSKNLKARAKRLPAGWLWRRNRQLGHETGHQSEWMRYPCLYSLWLAGLHINDQQPIEHEQIARLIEGARHYAAYLVYLRKIRPEDQEIVVREFSRTIEELSTKRAPRKVVARERFSESTPKARGKYLADSSGRSNPMAAAMQVGAGIGHLQEREQDVIHIGANLDARTVQIFMLIQERIGLYWDLWYFIKDHPIDYKSGSKLGIELIGYAPLSLEETIQRDGYRAAEAKLKLFRDQLWGICERPFMNNARHAAADLERVMARAGIDEAAKLHLVKIRNGIRWIFANHFWWMFFLGPLSMLIHDLLLAQRTLRRGTGEKGKIPISKSLAPEEFGRLEKALAAFEERLAKCSDEHLEHPMKPRLKKILKLIHQKIQEDDWRAVKLVATKMARIF